MKKSSFFIALYLVLTLTYLPAQDTLVLQPGPEGKDAYINSYYDENFGDYSNLYAIAGTNSGDPFWSRALLEFDLSEIPENAGVLKVELSLYFANEPAMPYFHFGDNGATLQRIIEPWDEHTVTWYNQPGTSSQNQAFLLPSAFETQDYPDIDVTELFKDILNDPENSHGIMLKLQVEEVYRRLFFASGDYLNPLLWPKLEIILCDKPLPGFSYTIDDLTVNFQDTSKFADQYFWSFGNGFYSDIQNPTFTYSTAGYYEVVLKTFNECGADSVYQVIFVGNVGITAPEDNCFSIYPNPAKHEIFIRSSFSGLITVDLLDLSGKQVFEQKLNSIKNETFNLSLKEIKSGVYIVSLKSDQGQVFNRLVVTK